jgi:hypothetical protein
VWSHIHCLSGDGWRLYDGYRYPAGVITIQKVNTLADDFLAFDALLFLTSCILSYWALRARGYARMHRIERVADGIFILGLLGMGAICVFTVYEFTAG